MSTERQELIDQLDESREHLAASVDALGEKLDVKARAQDTVASVKAKATDERSRRMAAVLAAGAVATVGVILWRRRS